MNNREKEEIERIKRATTETDALPLIKMCLDIKDKSKEEREEFKKTLKEAFDETGSLFLMRAFIEGDMTEEEYLQWAAKGIDISLFGSILQGYYMKKDKKIPEDDEVVVVTSIDSNSYKHKEELMKRFHIMIIDPNEALTFLEKQMRQNAIHK